MVNIFLKPNLHIPKSQGGKTYGESTLFPILSLDKLLPEVEKKHYLNKLQEIATLPDDYFKIFYEDLIDKFALFVQVLPEIYGDELGGLLNDGLRRALLSVQILHETQEDKPHPLFLFTVFSIALLSDIGQVLNYRIMISDEKGGFIDEWYPNLGFMVEFGDYFKLRPYEGTPISLVRNVTPIFARQLLNDTSITWLSSNQQIFDMWLAFLNKGEDWAGGLGKILKLDKKQFEARKIDILMPIDIKLTEPLNVDMAEKFLAWLKNGLLNGSISYNESDSKVHVVQYNALDISVFLQAPGLFQQFIHAYTKGKNWMGLCKQFNYLGLTRLSGADVRFEHFFAEYPNIRGGKHNFLAGDKGTLASPKNVKDGMVVKDARMLFGAKVPLSANI